MTIRVALIITYAIASRLAYVGWVGYVLRRQDRDAYFTRLDGVEGGYRKFRRRATILMRNDAVSIIAVCLVTRYSPALALPHGWLFLMGAVLAMIGFGVKTWAARTLGDAAYYWHNFFALGEHVAPDPPGPYRYLSNPMYTVGYLHAYGLALALGSVAGLALACFDQLAILAFHHLVEKPHYDRLTLPTTGR